MQLPIGSQPKEEIKKIEKFSKTLEIQKKKFKNLTQNKEGLLNKPLINLLKNEINS